MGVDLVCPPLGAGDCRTMVRLLAASVLPLLLLLLSPETAGAERYCGSDTPLDTPYFAPFQQTREEAVGCWAAPPASDHAHVLRAEDVPGEEVTVHILGKEEKPYGVKSLLFIIINKFLLYNIHKYFLNIVIAFFSGQAFHWDKTKYW